MKIFYHKSKKINVSPIKTARRWIIMMPAAKNLAHFCNKSLFDFVALGAR